MRKTSWSALGLAVLASLAVTGCRMCQDCHDYSSPVAGSCHGALHGCRAGGCASSANPHAAVVASATETAGPTLRR